jgi:hypothetical protein
MDGTIGVRPISLFTPLLPEFSRLWLLQSLLLRVDRLAGLYAECLLLSL